MVGNRVKKLMKEQENLNKQIKKADQAAYDADAAKKRYEYGQSFKASMANAN